MANMSYCRFQNTVNDFEDCLEALQEEEELSKEEERAKNRLYELAKDFVEEYEVLNAINQD